MERASKLGITISQRKHSKNRFTRRAFLTCCLFALIILSTLSIKRGASNNVIAQASETITFAAIGDYGGDNIDHSNVAAMIQSWNPDFIITQGDNRYGNLTFDNIIGKRFCNYLTGVSGGVLCPTGNSSTNGFFPSIGNHDYSDGAGISEYLNYFDLPGSNIVSSSSSGNERYYDFVMGDVHFFALDSDPQEPDGNGFNSVQAQWLQAQAAASTSRWQVAYFHHAPYSSSSVHGSDPTLQWPFALWGIDVVIAGHDHTYERIFKDDVVYFVNGLGGQSIYGLGTPIAGSQIRYNDDSGAMRITADRDAMTFEFLSIDDGANGGNGGLLIDPCTISWNNSPSMNRLPPAFTRTRAVNTHMVFLPLVAMYNGCGAKI